MGRRRGPALTRGQVVEAAVRIVQQEGADALGIARVAREIGIKPASMYNHVASGDALARAVILAANVSVVEAFKASVRGVNAPVAQLRALADALRTWARDNGGLYTLMSRIEPDNDDPDFIPVYADLLDLFARPFGQLGVAAEDQVHAIRGLRAALHGFILLEQQGQFQLLDDVGESYQWLVDAVIRGCVQARRRGAPPTNGETVTL